MAVAKVPPKVLPAKAPAVRAKPPTVPTARPSTTRSILSIPVARPATRKVAAVPSAPTPSPSPIAVTPTPPDKRIIIFGAALTAITITAFILLLTLPWYLTTEFGAATVTVSKDRSELNPETAYSHMIMTWPFIALGGLALAGAAIIGLQFLPARYARWKRPLMAVAWASIAIDSFLILLAGARWVGGWVMFLWGNVDATFALLGPPWILAGLGVALFAALAYFLGSPIKQWWTSPTTTKNQRLAAWTGLTTAVFLLATPFLPHMTSEFGAGQRLVFNETHLTSDFGFSGLKSVGTDLEWTRLTFWIIGSLAFASVGLEALRTKPWIPGDLKPMLRTYFLAAIPLAVAVIFTILYYVDVLEAVEKNPVFQMSYNHLPAVTVAALAAFYAAYAARNVGSGTPAPTSTTT